MVSRHPRRRSLRPLAGTLLFGCLLLRTLIPPGYMPGNLLAGDYMTLCPQGLPAAVAERFHAGHHGTGSAVLDADRLCPLATALLAAAPPPAEPAPLAPLPPYDSVKSETAVPPTSVLVLLYASRAPPVPGTPTRS